MRSKTDVPHNLIISLRQTFSALISDRPVSELNPRYDNVTLHILDTGQVLAPPSEVDCRLFGLISFSRTDFLTF